MVRGYTDLSADFNAHVFQLLVVISRDDENMAPCQRHDVQKGQDIRSREYKVCMRFLRRIYRDDS